MNDLARKLLAWYERDGRYELPWRTARDPYYTLVSEVMLQQTQVDRVVPAFEAFVAAYPSIEALARAPLPDVLRAWRGMGYNARAVRLKRTAEIVVAQWGGRIPTDARALRTLPGIGAYSAAAMRAFGFDIDDVPMDVNLRRIVHRLVLGIEYPPLASEAELIERGRAIAPRGRAHDWNSALMDLGTAICTARAPRCQRCPVRDECRAAPIDAKELEAGRAAHAATKSPQRRVSFERSSRFARGRIVDRLRSLKPGEAISLLDLQRDLEPAFPETTVPDLQALVGGLARDGLVSVRGEGVALAE